MKLWPCINSTSLLFFWLLLFYGLQFLAVAQLFIKHPRRWVGTFPSFTEPGSWVGQVLMWAGMPAWLFFNFFFYLRQSRWWIPLPPSAFRGHGAENLHEDIRLVNQPVFVQEGEVTQTVTGYSSGAASKTLKKTAALSSCTVRWPQSV